MVKIKLTNTELQIAKAMYEEGLTLAKIGKIYGMSRQAVWERFKKANIPTRKCGRPRGKKT